MEGGEEEASAAASTSDYADIMEEDIEDLIEEAFYQSISNFFPLIAPETSIHQVLETGNDCRQLMLQSSQYFERKNPKDKDSQNRRVDHSRIFRFDVKSVDVDYSEFDDDGGSSSSSSTAPPRPAVVGSPSNYSLRETQYRTSIEMQMMWMLWILKASCQRNPCSIQGRTLDDFYNNGILSEDFADQCANSVYFDADQKHMGMYVTEQPLVQDTSPGMQKQLARQREIMLRQLFEQTSQTVRDADWYISLYPESVVAPSIKRYSHDANHRPKNLLAGPGRFIPWSKKVFEEMTIRKRSTYAVPKTPDMESAILPHEYRNFYKTREEEDEDGDDDDDEDETDELINMEKFGLSSRNYQSGVAIRRKSVGTGGKKIPNTAAALASRKNHHLSKVDLASAIPRMVRLSNRMAKDEILIGFGRDEDIKPERRHQLEEGPLYLPHMYRSSNPTRLAIVEKHWELWTTLEDSMLLWRNEFLSAFMQLCTHRWNFSDQFFNYRRREDLQEGSGNEQGIHKSGLAPCIGWELPTTTQELSLYMLWMLQGNSDNYRYANNIENLYNELEDEYREQQKRRETERLMRQHERAMGVISKSRPKSRPRPRPPPSSDHLMESIPGLDDDVLPSVLGGINNDEEEEEPQDEEPDAEDEEEEEEITDYEKHRQDYTGVHQPHNLISKLNDISKLMYSVSAPFYRWLVDSIFAFLDLSFDFELLFPLVVGEGVDEDEARDRQYILIQKYKHSTLSHIWRYLQKKWHYVYQKVVLDITPDMLDEIQIMRNPVEYSISESFEQLNSETEIHNIIQFIQHQKFVNRTQELDHIFFLTVFVNRRDYPKFSNNSVYQWIKKSNTIRRTWDTSPGSGIGISPQLMKMFVNLETLAQICRIIDYTVDMYMFGLAENSLEKIPKTKLKTVNVNNSSDGLNEERRRRMSCLINLTKFLFALPDKTTNPTIYNSYIKNWSSDLESHRDRCLTERMCWPTLKFIRNMESKSKSEANFRLLSRYPGTNGETNDKEDEEEEEEEKRLYAFLPNTKLDEKDPDYSIVSIPLEDNKWCRGALVSPSCLELGRGREQVILCAVDFFEYFMLENPSISAPSGDKLSVFSAFNLFKQSPQSRPYKSSELLPLYRELFPYSCADMYFSQKFETMPVFPHTLSVVYSQKSDDDEYGSSDRTPKNNNNKPKEKIHKVFPENYEHYRFFPSAWKASPRPLFILNKSFFEKQKNYVQRQQSLLRNIPRMQLVGDWYLSDNSWTMPVDKACLGDGILAQLKFNLSADIVMVKVVWSVHGMAKDYYDNDNDGDDDDDDDSSDEEYHPGPESKEINGSQNSKPNFFSKPPPPSLDKIVGSTRLVDIYTDKLILDRLAPVDSYHRHRESPPRPFESELIVIPMFSNNEKSRIVHYTNNANSSALKQISDNKNVPLPLMSRDYPVLSQVKINYVPVDIQARLELFTSVEDVGGNEPNPISVREFKFKAEIVFPASNLIRRGSGKHYRDGGPTPAEQENLVYLYFTV